MGDKKWKDSTKATSKLHNALKIGITGGIGGGKTTVCHIFENLGIPVYYADDRAKSLMSENQKVKMAIQSHFGEAAYLPDGQLDRAYLASIVFNDKKKLETLNGIVHPAVQADAERWHQRQLGVPYTIREAALLVENGSYKKLDKLIVVTAPEIVRIQRVMQRDGVDEPAVRLRISKQLSEGDKIAVADFIIFNDGVQSILQQVIEIHKKIAGLHK